MTIATKPPRTADVLRDCAILVGYASPLGEEAIYPDEWKRVSTLLVGSAASEAEEQERLGQIRAWMWERLGDPAVVAALPEEARAAWERMLTERTYDAARAASGAAYEADEADEDTYKAACEAACACVADAPACSVVQAAATAAAHVAHVSAAAATRAASEAYRAGGVDDDYRTGAYWQRAGHVDASRTGLRGLARRMRGWERGR